MAHRVVEGLGRLTGQRAARRVGDGPGDQHRKRRCARREDVVHGSERRLGVERIEHRFDEQQIHSAVDQAVRRFGVGRHELIEAHRPEPRIVHVGRDRGGLVGRPQNAGDEARRAVVLGLPRAHRVARKARGGLVELACKALHAVVGERDRSGVEGIGLEDVRAGLEVLPVDIAHQRGLRERQEVVVAAQLARPVAKAAAPIVLFRKARALDHGAHRAVEQQDASCENFL